MRRESRLESFTPHDTPLLSAVEQLTESETALESATLAFKAAETALESAVELEPEDAVPADAPVD